MTLNWPLYWKRTRKQGIVERINKMNKDKKYSSYYDNAIRYVEFSEKYSDWTGKIDWDSYSPSYY